MAEGRKPEPGPFAALLGDLVRSRHSSDRAGLHNHVTGALSAVNSMVESLQPLTLTVGDEFQALYPEIHHAIDATLLVRLHLIGFTEVRFGIGWGTLEVFVEEALPFQQDGPAWWAARAALEEVDRSSKRRMRPRSRRTAFGPDDEERANLVNALLVHRDVMLERYDETDARILLGLIAGDAQDVIAKCEGVSQSAIAQRIRRSEAYALLQGRELLKGGV